MTYHIAEELPKRKFPAAGPSPVDAQKKGSEEGEKKSPEKKIRQAVYDIRYRARREDVPLQTAFSQYIQNSSLSAQERIAVKQKLFGKGGMQAEDFDMRDAASSSVANALFKVFVEGVHNTSEEIHLDYLQELSDAPDRKYKVRVTDKNSGKSYVRYATREKINQLRANPNIESVEMTEYGEPYEGERKKGERTAAVKAGKDYDGDGKVESGAKEHAGAVHNAIQRKKGGNPDGQDTSSVKEEFVSEGKKKKIKDDEDKQIDVMKGDNKSLITVNPPEGSKKTYGESLQKFNELLNEKKLTKAETAKKEEIAKALKPKYGKTSKTYAIATSVAKRVAEESDCGCQDDEPKSKKDKGTVDDPRAISTKVNLLKNKLRAMGMKNPIVMTAGYEPDGNVISERGDEPGERDDNPDVRAHNRSLRDKKGKRLYPSGRAGYGRRPDISKDPRYGSVD